MKQRLKYFIPLIFFLSCGSNTIDNSPKIKNVDSSSKTIDKNVVGQTYYFDSSSYVNGCARAYLQKISKDYQYELLLELKFDSIPKFQESKLDSFSKTISISLNKYSKDNTYINSICDDAPMFIKDQKLPNKFIAVSGSLTITKVEKERSTGKVSISTKDLILKDSSGHEIILPKEEFKDVMIGWYAG